MQAIIEFMSVAENGLIRIPDEYRGKAQGEIRVIIVPAGKIVAIASETATTIQHYLDEHRSVTNTAEDTVEWQRKLREEWERAVY